MGQILHGSAKTTHAVRAAIHAFLGSVAARLGRVLIKLVGLTGVRSPPTYPSRRWAAFSVPRAPKRARPDLYYPLKSAS